MTLKTFIKIVCNSNYSNKCLQNVRHSNTLANSLVDHHRETPLSRHTRLRPSASTSTTADKAPAPPNNYKEIYPEFLPDPVWWKRDRIRERLEQDDMLARREVIDLPEFYVGSYLSVTCSDEHAPGKRNQFVGICIQRCGHGLRANFTLRNVIDTQGIEIRYDLYNPSVIEIKVLKLEKRVDAELFYLRDAPQHYSTVPMNFEPVPLPPGVAAPTNDIKVKLNPRPWLQRWERVDLKGVEDFGLEQRFYDRAKEVAKPWLKNDTMRDYRQKINDDESATIMRELFTKMSSLQVRRTAKLREKALAKQK